MRQKLSIVTAFQNILLWFFVKRYQTLNFIGRILLKDIKHYFFLYLYAVT